MTFLLRVAASGLTLLISAGPALAQPSAETPVTLSNWTAPPFWSTSDTLTKPQRDGLEDPAPVAAQSIEAVPTAPLPFTGINPCRIADTRGNGFSGSYGPPSLVPGASRNFVLAGQCGIAAGAEAVSLNITVTNTQGPGFILIYPQGGSQPSVSTLNYVAGQTIANAAVVPLGTAGGITVIAGVSGTDLIIDTNGYYAPQTVVNTVNGLSGAVTLSAGTNVSITPSGQTVTIANTAPAPWLLTGNSLSLPGPFLGTTNNQALELKVNGQRALRLEPNATSPNVIGGFSGNAALGAHGSTIAGGGFAGSGNTVFADFGTVGGGFDNQAQGVGATIPGGSGNIALGDNSFAAGTVTLAAGSGSFALGNTAQAIHPGAFVWSCCAAGGASVSSRDNEFQVRADGGAAFLRGLPMSALSSAALQAENGFASGETAWLFNRNSANADDVVRALKHPSAPGNFFRCTNYDGTTVTNKCHIDANGAFTAGSDFAESLPARGGKAGFEPGDVLVASREVPGGVEKSSQRYDTRAIGVYSTRPGFLGADKNGETRVDPDDIPVAITGIVPAKVTSENGPIEAGDLLTTSSTPGYAMKATPVSVAGVEIYPGGTILGKALTPLTGEKGKIRMLVLPR